MSERKLWCEDNSMVQSRVVRFIGSFKKYGKLVNETKFNYGRPSVNQQYELSIDGLGEITFDIRNTLVRRDPKEDMLYDDIAGIGFIFVAEGDRFMFTVPSEWVESYVHTDVVGPFYPLESLGSEVLSFLEDYL